MVRLKQIERPDGPLRYLLFDVDGTLIETLADIAGSVNHALRRLGFPTRSIGEVNDFVGRGVEHLMRRSLGAGREDLLEKGLGFFREHYGEHCLDNSKLMPGAVACLEKFADRPLGVVSNKPERYVRRMLEGLGIDRYFRVVFGGDSVEEKKPSPLMVTEILKRLGVSREGGILVGDHTVDIETGRAAGVYTVAVLGGFASRAELEAASPDYLAENPPEVSRIFD